VPAEVVEEVPGRALAVYAHPNDADVVCGGTLAKWSQAGCETHLVVCTDGGRGTTDADCDPKEFARRRAEELDRAAAIVGLAEVHILGVADGELDDDRSLVAELVGWIRRLRPDVVFGHDPTAVFFGQEYFNHRDHRAAGWALLDAMAPAAALPHYFPERGDPHLVQAAYLTGTLEPDVWVDISTSVEQKAQAVQQHRSQLSGDGEWVGEVVRSRALEEGRRAGVGHAEGFRRLRLAG
jgi:LmbE family N-acetylglucosaminyl deacetylase